MTDASTPDSATRPDLVIGTRGSPLALAQAFETRARLSAAHGLDPASIAINVIKTTGDRVTDRPLGQIGGKGLFTKEIEEALLAGTVDIAVHSMKDMPVAQPDGLGVTCLLPREDVRDAFVSHRFAALADLPQGTVVGTSSLRRRAQLLHRRPDLRIVEFRGNVQTRMQKLADGVAEGTFLAMAGLNRLKMDGVPAHPIGTDDMLPAVAQGAIGIEQRLDDARISELLAAINDGPTAQRLAAERAYLAGLDGSCQTPIGGLAVLDGATLHLRGEVISPDGSARIADAISGPVSEAAALGTALAARMHDDAHRLLAG